MTAKLKKSAAVQVRQVSLIGTNTKSIEQATICRDAERLVEQVEVRQVGVLDAATSTMVSGWAINLSNDLVPATVDIVVNGERLASVQCTDKRKDVKEAGLPTDVCGFHFDMSLVAPFLKNPEISVRFSDTQHELTNSPRRVVELDINTSLLSTNQLIEQVNPANASRFFGFENASAISKAQLLEKIRAHKAKGGDIVVFPPLVDWNIPLFQRPQHMANWLARTGALVIYASVAWKFDSADGYYELTDRLFWTNYVDEILPELPESWISIYSTNFNYKMADLLEWKRRGHKIIYEYIDHIDPKISGSQSATLAELYAHTNKSNIDLFVASADALYNELYWRLGDDRLALVPNGVDLEFYEQNRDRQEEGILPSFADIIKLSKKGAPIVGYFGAIAPWLDYELIKNLAVENQDLHFVYVGPSYDLSEELPTASNIHWIGKIDYHILPMHAAWFDVCFIPFESGDIAKTTSPLKLFEYFALQKPVVVTSGMAECVQYPEVYHGADAQGVALAIRNALKRTSDNDFKARLQELAQENSWKARAERMLVAMKATTEVELRRETSPISFNHESVSTLAFNIERPDRICGSKLLFNHKKNTLTVSYAQGDFYIGDVLSTVIRANLAECPSVARKFTLSMKGNKLELKEGYVIVEVFLKNSLVKLMDYKDLDKGETIEYCSNKGCTIEVRLRVLQNVPQSWNPGDAYSLIVSGFSMVPGASERIGELYFANPCGSINPLVRSRRIKAK